MTDHELRRRIDTTFHRDRWMAIIAVALLWISLLYVFRAVYSNLPDPAVRTALLIGCGAVLLFNTASVLAMIRHYKQDKEHIYSLDLRHLDENRARKNAAKQPGIEVAGI